MFMKHFETLRKIIYVSLNCYQLYCYAYCYNVHAVAYLQITYSNYLSTYSNSSTITST